MDGLSKKTFINAFEQNDVSLQADILWDLFEGLYKKVDVLTVSREKIRKLAPYLIVGGAFIGGFVAFFTEKLLLG